MNPQAPLFRLVYVSRSQIAGDAATLEAQVGHILAVSRRNNARAAITGALLFNRDCFAQTLEGAMHDVQATFERIQCDPRHRHTVVLHAAPVPDRAFADWSMAHAGRVEHAALQFDTLAGPNTPHRGTEAADLILTLLRDVVRRTETV